MFVRVKFLYIFVKINTTENSLVIQWLGLRALNTGGPRFSPWLENPTNCKARPKTKHGTWDLPGGPVVKTPRFHAGCLGLIPGWETKIPHTFQCDRKK